MSTSKDRGGPESLLAMWLNTSAQFWESTFKMWSGDSGTPKTPDRLDEEARSRTLQSMETTFKTWKALSSLMKEPEVQESVVKGVTALPELVSKMTKPAIEGYLHFQREWMDRAGRIGKSSAAYTFENLDQEAFKALLETVRNGIPKVSERPTIGVDQVLSGAVRTGRG